MYEVWQASTVEPKATVDWRREAGKWGTGETRKMHYGMARGAIWAKDRRVTRTRSSEVSE
jgi:hypothetical protein